MNDGRRDKYGLREESGMIDMPAMEKVKKKEKIIREREEKEKVAAVCPAVVLRV